MSMIERLALTTAGVRQRWLRLGGSTSDSDRPIALRLAAELRAMPLVLTVAVVAGIGFVSAITPISGRGDFGQWLMTSRYYLGQSVPSYRVVTDLPPLVPVLLAAIRVVVPDPSVALQTLNILVLLGVALSFFAVGMVLLDDAQGGLLSVIVAFLVTDRFLELAAFGGLLQAVSILFINLAVAAFAWAGAHLERSRRWWAFGSVALVLAAMAHVGTAIIGIPIGVSVAAFFLLTNRRFGWRRIVSVAWPSVVVLAALAIYLWLVLLPAGRDYVTNPASLGYRGPARLLSGLFSYWPTTVVMLVGAGSILLGMLGELFRRTPGPRVALLLWTAVAWGALLYASLIGASTDYPRFATLVLAPLVVGAAGALTWLPGALGGYLRESPGSGRSSLVMPIAAALLILVMAPFAVTRYQTQMNVYGTRDPDSLGTAVSYLNQALGTNRGAVLTSVRDGKWFEGVTGRDALFSQPVRYAFRPIEWTRSVDADAILRASAALTNEFFFVKFTATATSGAVSAPRGLVIAANHGGEFVDLLQVQASDTKITTPGSVVTMAEAGPKSSTASIGPQEASIRTTWSHVAGKATVSYTQTVALLKNGSTMSITANTPRDHLQTLLRPVGGMAFTSARVSGQEADVCLTQIGDREPCLRIWASQPDVVVAASDRGLSVASKTSSTIRLYITDLTAGPPSVGLQVIDPKRLVAQYRISAALLSVTDPLYPARRLRLEALGFRVARVIGTYAVFLHGPSSVPP